MAAENGEGTEGTSQTPQNGGADGQLVGRRVRVAGHAATVRWGPGELQAPPSKRPPASAPAAGETAAPVGGYPVDKQDATQAASTVQVVGIEYDEPGHGKHDGTHQGARLFSCPAGHGSFVKIEKLDFGVSIQWAIADKYFTGLLPEAAKKNARAEVLDAMEYTDSKGRSKELNVELVGRHKLEQQQQRLEGFVEASLADTCLELRYPDNVWEGDWSLPNLKSLWLDKTLLGEWGEVLAILELCPQLEWLSLAKNRFKPLPADGILKPPRGAPEPGACDARLVLSGAGPRVSRLRTLVLTETGVTWEDVLTLDQAGHFPSLEHLHLARNNLSEGVPELSGFQQGGRLGPLPKLRSVVLDHNGISDWRVLQRAVDAFPNLESLHLNGNKLGQTMEGLAELIADEKPRKLVSLSLMENCLSTWQVIGALSSYALLELKAQRNPVTEGETACGSPQMLRQILIALMPSLLRLNASETPLKERTQAERYFLSLVKQQHRVIGLLGETCDIDGHVARLRKIHGDVSCGDASEEAQATRAALVNALVEVSLKPMGANICTQPIVRKKVPHTMTVADLKRLCYSVFKQVPLDRISLTLADPALPWGMPFEDDSRELGFYGVADGAEIRVDDLQDMSVGPRETKKVSSLAGRLAPSADDEV